MEKSFAKILMVLYLIILIWLVLFKLNFNILAVFNEPHRNLNLIPFAAPKMVNGSISYSEMIWNSLFFLPFGLLMSVNFKKVSFLSKLIVIVFFSLSAELIQYVFAIGATDITDVITNTFGGFLGLILYAVSNKFIKTENLDKLILAFGSLILVIFLSIHISHLMRRTKFR
jgi:glycopeptide antibiotics resistance protein